MRKLLFAAFFCAYLGPATILAQDRIYSFTGVCDASAAVYLSGDRFAVADDEVNLIQVYSLVAPGGPVATLPLSVSSTPATPPKKGSKKKKGKTTAVSQTDATVKAKKGPEADLEAAARMGDSLVWLGSHSRDAKGNEAPARREVFYSSISRDTAGVESLSPRSHHYTSLLDVLSASPVLAHLNLGLASTLSPKVAGGLNIEGITLLPDTSALLGLRNPLLGTQAILIHTNSPFEWSESKPVEVRGITPVNLDGRGIKDLAMLGADLLIASSAPVDSTNGALFSWKNYPTGKLQKLDIPDVRGLNIEGILPIPERNSVLLLSDDGTVIIDGKECKKLKDHSRRSFRGVELPVSIFVQ